MHIQPATASWQLLNRTTAAADQATETTEAPADSNTEVPADEVDESKFLLTDPNTISYGSFEDPDNPGEFINLTTPQQAWQYVAAGGTNSMLAIDSVLTAGYQAVSGDLEARLAEQGITGPAGTYIRYGHAEESESESEDEGNNSEDEPEQFHVTNEVDPDSASAIAAILNDPENEEFATGYRKLEELTQTTRIFHTQSRDSVLDGSARNEVGIKEIILARQPEAEGWRYQHDFGLRSNGENWSLDSQLYKVPLEDEEAAV